MTTPIASATAWNALVSPLAAGSYTLTADITFNDATPVSAKIIGDGAMVNGAGFTVYLDMTTNQTPFDVQGGTLVNVNVYGGTVGVPANPRKMMPVHHGCVTAGSLTFNLHKGTVRNCHARYLDPGSYGGGVCGRRWGGADSIVQFCSSDAHMYQNHPTEGGLMYSVGGIMGPEVIGGTSISNCIFDGNMAAAGSGSGSGLTSTVHYDSAIKTLTVRCCYFNCGTIPNNGNAGGIFAALGAGLTLNVEECIVAGSNLNGAILARHNSAGTLNVTNCYILTTQDDADASAITAALTGTNVGPRYLNLDSVYVTSASPYSITSNNLNGIVSAVRGVYVHPTATQFGNGSLSSGTITPSLADAYANVLPAQWDANVWEVATDATDTTFHTFKCFANPNHFTGYTTYDAVPSINRNALMAKGFLLSASTLTVSESGTSATFTVVLTAAPSQPVTITSQSSNTAEVGVSGGGTLTFSPADWYVAQTVTVTGVDDGVVDADSVSTITVSSASGDTDYDEILAHQTVSVTNTNIDVIELTLDKSAMTITEGATNTFTVELGTAPVGGSVVFDVSSNSGRATVSPAQLTFTDQNYNVAQTVTVTAVNNDLVDGQATVTITVAINAGASASTTYDAVDASTVTVTVNDNNFAGITSVAPLSVAEGTSNTFTVALTAQPVTDVVLSVTSANADRLTASPATLTFTTNNWNAAQTVTVSATSNAVVSDQTTVAVTVAVVAASSSDEFDNISNRNVAVTVTDASVPVIVASAATVTRTRLSAINPVTMTNSGGGSVTYTVSPALPAGLSIHAGTGTISGTPTSASVNTVYTITATNVVGIDTTTVQFQVLPLEPSIAVSVPSLVGTRLTSITPITAPNDNINDVLHYAIDPALPSGLSINSATGTITGVPTVVSENTVYTITGTNSDGTSTDTVELRILPRTPAIAFTQSNVMANISMATEAVVINSTDNDDSIVYTISPALPSGLTMSSTTGLISGSSNTFDIPGTTYTVTADNDNGSDTATVTLFVRDNYINAVIDSNVLVSTTDALNSIVLPDSTGHVVDLINAVGADELESSKSLQRRAVVDLLFTRANNASITRFATTALDLRLPADVTSKTIVLVYKAGQQIDLNDLDNNTAMYTNLFTEGESVTVLNVGALHRTVVFTANGGGSFTAVVGGGNYTVSMPVEGNTYTIEGVAFTTGSIFTNGNNISQPVITAPCLVKNTLVRLARPLRNVKIQHVRVGDLLLCDDDIARPVKRVIRSVSDNVCFFRRNAFKPGVPHCELGVTGNHLIRNPDDNRVYRASDALAMFTLPGMGHKSTRSHAVYHLETDKWSFFQAAGVGVETFSDGRHATRHATTYHMHNRTVLNRQPHCRFPGYTRRRGVCPRK